MVKDSAEYKGYVGLENLYTNLHNRVQKISRGLKRRAEKFRFEQYKMIFGERDDDIYISTYPKSGTTLMQMILYQLTTDGNMDFEHIYDVSPWIRNASLRKEEPINLPSPRLIKTHDNYNQFTKSVKGRFIHVYRNGMDAAVSLYNQHKNYNNNKLDFKEFVEDFIDSKSWFLHEKEWFRNKNNLPILHISYEDLIDDKRGQIEKIIAFCKIQPTNDAIDRAISYSSFEYMKKHENKFGHQPIEKKQIYDQFIRKGITGEGKKTFNKMQTEKFITQYEKIVKPYEINISEN